MVQPTPPGTGGTGAALERRAPGTLGPTSAPPPRAWAEAWVALVTVCGVGAAELLLLDLPNWVGAPFVLVGSAIAVDRLRLARRRRPAPEEEPEAKAALPAAEPAVPDGRAERLARHLEAAARPRSAVTPAENGYGYATLNGNGNGNGATPPAQAAVGYTCVPAEPYAAPLAADVELLTRWCTAAGVPLTRVVHDVENTSGKGGPALQWALEQVAAGQVGTLVVARLRNLSPTVSGMSPLLRWFTAPTRRLVAIEEEIDTATEAGRLAAIALAGIGSGENERLSERTRRGLEAARSRGKGRAGAAVADVPELRERILRMRSEGMTLQAIADTLNEEGVPTLRGGAKWRPSSVHTATGYRRPAPARGIQVPDEKPDA